MALYSREENNAVFHKQLSPLALGRVVAGTSPSEQNPTERAPGSVSGPEGQSQAADW